MHLSGGGSTFIKRLAEPIDYRRDITRYGNSNLYPQLVSEVMFRSPVTLAAVEALSSFTTGDGFTLNGDMIVNRHEQTLNDVLKNAVAPAYSTYNGFALHFNVNEIGGITEITNTNFNFVRFGLPDKDGIHFDVKVNQNWENDPNKTITRTAEVIDTFPLWQRRDDVPLDDIEEFSGFILYWTPVPDQYSKSTFDSVLDSAQVNSEIQIFELSNMQNGFQGGAIFLNRDSGMTDPDKRKLDASLADMKGAGKANSVYRFDVPADFDGSLLETLPANNQDRLFELTNENSSDRIITAFGMPKAILGIQPDTGMFNQEDIENAFVYYNLRTRDRRTTIADVFNRFMQFWHTGAVSVGEIKESQFVKVEKKDGGDGTN